MKAELNVSVEESITEEISEKLYEFQNSEDICDNRTSVECIELENVYTEYGNLMILADNKIKNTTLEKDKTVLSFKLKKIREFEANMRPMANKHRRLRLNLLNDFLVTVEYAIKESTS
ncbi:unnamed protein product [Oppiella nova]|uniref:Uncharacterized protein n=1 Tax=Oppiella nova TaxID=334625 RepID=A0A7R9LXE5_9ACAR|nr:unnamed protein product [Oppiella nova]CAG2167833.1 unnamed protein product [Oppiella nova]